jgi:cbb3-type cytochrome oxidase subunit 3
MISRGVISIENLQTIFSGNLFLYIFFAGAFIYFRKQQTGRNNNLDKTILALNNELRKMRTENEWRDDAVSQGM